LRSEADAERIRRLARELGRAVAPGTRMYLTGGATAVLEGWRDSTVDIDVRFEPDSDAALSRIKDLIDLKDVQSMVSSGQVEPARLLELYEGIEPDLFRFPAVDPTSLRSAIESLIEGLDSAGR
jgi:hypothetical protein